jgi:hypothetical protein
MKMKPLNSSEAAVKATVTTLKDEQRASFGAAWDVFGFFATGAKDSGNAYAEAKVKLAKAYGDFLDTNPPADRKAVVSQWVNKVAPDVRNTVDWYNRTH